MEVAVIVGVLVLLVLAGGDVFGVGGSGGGETASPLPLYSGGGMRLSPSDIAFYARSVGFAGDDLPISVAVALAESGGNTVAYNPETAAGTPTGQGSYGLWQIYRKVHPEFAGYDLYEPMQNASAAYQIYLAAGRSFQPWSAYKNGMYVSFLPAANAAVVA